MNNLVKLAKLPIVASISRRGLTTSSYRLYSAVDHSKPTENISLEKFDPNNYSIPIRQPTMDDLMEPYGSWKEAYEAERKKANFSIIRGAFCLATTLLIFLYSGIADGLMMPNLDNVMEDTEPFEFEQEGRDSCLNPELKSE